MNAQAVGGTGGLFEPGGAALLQSGLEQFAIGPAEQAALRAFADAAADGMLARLAQQVAQQSGVAPGSAAARLVDAFVSEEVLRCQAEGVEKLLGAWLEARSSGVAMHVPARIGAQLQAAVLEEMLAGKSTPARIDAEILAALSRLMLFLCSMLDLGVASWEQSIRRQSGVTDEDTALPNIRALRSLLDDMLATGGLFGLLQLRLEVTATLLRLPEALQRQLLRLVASRMRGALRQQDVICRTSRYEFAVVLPALSSPAQVTLAATKLLRQFDSPFTLHTREYRLVAYVGAVCAPDQANSVDDLLMFVRLSSFEARTRGSRLELFRDELNRASAHHFEIERELSQALENEQIELHLQPQIDAATGYCLGAEALLRWNNSARVAVPPQLVIEAADRAGLSAQLTRWVIVSACRMLAQLTQEDPSFNLSVNITANDLKDAELPDLLQQALTTFGVPAHCLTLELTENAMITDEQRCLEIMARLRQMRLRLSIDDFGTGYSSMVYLRRMPVQELKIDKVFVQRLAQYGRDREIVRSLVGLGHGLGLEVVAEGVEDGGVLDLLRSYGCDRMQGFHISPPLPRAQFIEWWRQGRRKPIGEY